MNTLAWLTGRLATVFARGMLRWAETTHGPHAVRLWAYSNLLAASDEPALIGVMVDEHGRHKGRGHRLTAAGTSKRYELWRRAVAVWALTQLDARQQIVISSWRPARPLLEFELRVSSR